MGKQFYGDQINMRARNHYAVEAIHALQEQIEVKRMELNELATLDALSSAEVLKKSRELDLLLNAYHHIIFCCNVGQ